MSAESLQIKISADVAGALKSMQGLSDNLKKMSETGEASLENLTGALKLLKQEAAKKTDIASLAVLNTSIEKVEAQIKKLKSTTDPFAKFNTGANKAASAMTDVNRVIQDAPYGFIGIQNNINPLIESFQRLKLETGTTGGAFKAMAGSLIGPAGIGLAVSIASSLLIAFGDKLFKISKNVNLFKDAMKEAAENVGGQVVKLEIFKTKLNDVNLTSADRLKIAKEYNKTADETNKIDLKQIDNLDLINQRISAQNSLVLKRALSAAALSKLTEASSKLIESELTFQAELEKRGLKEADVVKLAKERVNASKQEKTARENINTTVRKGLDGVRNYSVEAARAASVTEDSIIGLYNTIQKGREDLGKKAASLGGFFSIDGLTTKDPKEKLKKESKDLLSEVFNDLQALIKKIPLDVDFTFVPKITADKSSVDEYLNSLKDLATSKPIPIDAVVVLRQVEQSKFVDGFAGLGQQIGNQIAPEFGDAFSKIFRDKINTAIGQGFAGEQLKDFANNVAASMSVASIGINAALNNFNQFITAVESGKNVFASFGEFIMNTIKQVVADLAKAALAASILSIVTGGASGGGLSFLGAFKSLLVPNANGGIYSGPTAALVGEYAGASNNPEVIAPLSKLKGIMGSAGMGNTMSGELRIRGNDLVLALDRNKRSQNRLG